MKHRALLPLLLLTVGLLPAVAGRQPEPPALTIEGQVFDDAGAAVAGVPVRLLMTRRLVTLTDLSLRDEFAEGPSTRTDDAGFFRIDLRPDPDFDYYYLRFYDRTGFDAVRYALPADEDVTAAVRAGRPIIVQRRLVDAPNWPAVVRELERVGGSGSARGRILRVLGLPDQVVPRGGGVTEWRYERARVRYLIQDGEVVERASLAPAEPVSP
jgi:hypothetical protein